MTTTPTSPLTLHADIGSDWAFVTEGDQVLWEGHVDDAAWWTLIEYLATPCREIVSPHRPWKLRSSPEGKLSVADVFAIPEKDA